MALRLQDFDQVLAFLSPSLLFFSPSDRHWTLGQRPERDFYVNRAPGRGLLR